jgi:hypothetical protein
MVTDTSRTTRARWARAAIIPLIAAGTLLAACSSDEEETPPEPQTYTVNAIDFGYENLPAEARVGDSLTLTNASTTELHEIVAIALPAEEERSVADLMALPEEELRTLFAGAPAMVILVTPGSSDPIVAVGDPTVTAAGRYAILCGIPEGANPEEYMAAAATGEQPDVEGGPPHFVLGMFGEVNVSE